MLRTRLFKGFAIIVLMFTVLSALFGFVTIKRRIMDEAQNKVRFDLLSAWSVFNGRLEQIETVVALVEGKREVRDSCREGDWSSPDLRSRLETIRRRFGLDFLGVAAADGTVVFRSTPPFNTGDSRLHDPAIAHALAGERVSGIVLWSRPGLKLEADGLAEQAFLELEDTPHSRMISKTVEDRGMIMITAAPIRGAAGVEAVVYGGILLNRNLAMADRMSSIIYGDEKYEGTPLGATTIFLDDIRISTTVLKRNGNRALGTRVSKEVANQVLDNAKSWVGEAFVVNNRYLTAYDPIKDVDGKTVGMLYVGILRQPFMDYGRRTIIQYLLLCVFALLVSLVIAFWIANRLSRPIHRLVSATRHMSNGNGVIKVPAESACDEVGALILAFNDMSAKLVERENRLKATNQSYMETLGFVSHELKSPISSVVNYLYLMRQLKLGPLTEKQEKAMLICEKNVNRIVEMVRHYLNLSRIENQELAPSLSRVSVKEDILMPLADSMEASIQAENMTISDSIGYDLEIRADLNMTREIFENLISNAVKYGTRGSTITVAAGQADGFIKFSVHNEGSPIPPDMQEKMFQKFFRVEHGDNKQRGTGLGLFITRHIVESHGGTISLESSEEKGTTFYFTMPAWSENSDGPNGGKSNT